MKKSAQEELSVCKLSKQIVFKSSGGKPIQSNVISNCGGAGRFVVTKNKHYI